MTIRRCDPVHVFVFVLSISDERHMTFNLGGLANAKIIVHVDMYKFDIFEPTLEIKSIFTNGSHRNCIFNRTAEMDHIPSYSFICTCRTLPCDVLPQSTPFLLSPFMFCARAA